MPPTLGCLDDRAPCSLVGTITMPDVEVVDFGINGRLEHAPGSLPDKLIERIFLVELSSKGKDFRILILVQ